MIHIEESIEIERPIEEVFAFVSNLANSPHWQNALLMVRKTTPEPLGVGTRFTFVRDFQGQKVAADNVFTRFIPNELVEFETTSGPIMVRSAYLFARTPGGSKVTSRLEMHAEELMGNANPALAAEIREELIAEFGVLKTLLEDRA